MTTMLSPMCHHSWWLKEEKRRGSIEPDGREGGRERGMRAREGGRKEGKEGVRKEGGREEERARGKEGGRQAEGKITQLQCL